MFFDTHCHLDFESFGDDLPSVLTRADEAQVTQMVTIGAGRGTEHAHEALNLAKAHPGRIFATVGVHPHDADELKEMPEALIGSLTEIAKMPEVVAIGEVGLDYHYEHSPRAIQQDVFRRFIDLSKRVKKPLVVHTRSAREETLDILRTEHAKDVGGIIHCFSEDIDFARQALNMNFVCSFSGIVTFKNAVTIQEAAAFMPADKLLIETDAPFLAPVPFRGKRNEPSYVVHTAKRIAELRRTTLENIAAQTTLNAQQLFRIRPVLLDNVS